MISLNGGTFTALVTPFNQEGRLDEEGLRLLIRRQTDITEGVVLLGSTGETPTLTSEEKQKILDIAREEIAPPSLFIAGTGTYATVQTIKNTADAEEAGADAALVITPYYNKPTQEGIYRHFKAIAEATTIPIIIYNNPGRTGQNLQMETLKRLLDIPSIIGIKECSGNIHQINEILGMVRKERSDFSVLSGDDSLAFAFMAFGGNGLVSVLSNLLPREVKGLVDAARVGNFYLAREKHFHLMPLIKVLEIETNPIPIKRALDLCGLPSGECRLPLCPLGQENALKLENMLKQYVVNCTRPLA
jgi:4-hydroxy-tetrahydrodipicolinate synthase